MSEFDLIRDYFRHATPARGDVLLGIGDDGALLQVPEGKQLAMSMDTLLVGRHFLSDVDPLTLGHKALAVNLSDLAAMGAQPAWAMLGISLPEDNQYWRAWLKSFMQGFAELAKQHEVQLVGGDTTRGDLSISIQVTGFVEPDKALRRDAAQVGDVVYVSGQIGDAALALLLENADAQERLDKPTPRLGLGQALAGVAHAAIDVSDGLLSDLQHICQASGVAACIHLENTPTPTRVKNYIQATANWQAVINGGDDYELLFTAPVLAQQTIKQIAQQQGIAVQAIGHIQQGSGVKIIMPDGQISEEVSSGYDHFK
jgi:thiamine-monophosphate kinase